MKLALKLAAGCAILIAAPASAQILGGGGGGGLGGSIGGAGGQLGGQLGGTIGNTTGHLGGAADIDRRNGRADVGGNGSVTGSRLRPLNRSARASAGAGASVQRSPATLAAAGSLAASGGAAIPVSPGMIVRDTSGRVIGRVQSLRARANGVVDNVIVRVGDRLASLPDENFSASGNVLVSAMSQGQVSRAAGAQNSPQSPAGPERQTPRRGGPQNVDKQ